MAENARAANNMRMAENMAVVGSSMPSGQHTAGR